MYENMVWNCVKTVRGFSNNSRHSSSNSFKLTSTNCRRFSIMFAFICWLSFEARLSNEEGTGRKSEWMSMSSASVICESVFSLVQVLHSSMFLIVSSEILAFSARSNWVRCCDFRIRLRFSASLVCISESFIFFFLNESAENLNILKSHIIGKYG